MKKSFGIISLSVILIFIVCVVAYHLQNHDKNMIIEAGECCPHVTIYLQPYDNFTQKEAEQLKTDLDNHLDNIICDDFIIDILPNKQLSDSFLGETKKKYRTDKIINTLKENADKHHIYIGITHHDISREYKNGVKDWGVLGSSIPDYHACVVSDHRLKHKRRDLWKVIAHEFIHTYYNYGHCPEDNPYCLMKDAKGKADFSNKIGLCKTCKENINI